MNWLKKGKTAEDSGTNMAQFCREEGGKNYCDYSDQSIYVPGKGKLCCPETHERICKIIAIIKDNHDCEGLDKICDKELRSVNACGIAMGIQ